MALQPPDHDGKPDTDALQLLRRLLVRRYGPGAYQEPMLLLGRLPDGLRNELPVPEGAQVLGSAIHTDQLEVALDVPLDAEAALEWYRERLVTLTWRENDPNSPSEGGFTHTGQPDHLFFCASDSGPSLSVVARPTPEGPADVRLVLRAEAGQCNPRRQQAGLPPLPTLGPPPRGRHQYGGFSGHSNGIHSHARLVATPALDLTSALQHYSDILERGGWQRSEGGQDGGLAWAVWSFSDSSGLPCHGTLLVSRHPLAPNTYLLDLYAVRVEDPAPASLFEPGHPTSPTVSEHHDPAQLLRLAQRLLTTSVAYDQAPESVQLYPGTLPLGLDELPLPADGRIVGGMTSPLSTIGLLQTGDTVEATLDFFRAALPAAGWIAHDLSLGNRFQEGGFAHRGSETRLAYGLDEQTELTVEVYELPGGGTEARMERQLVGASRRRPIQSPATAGSSLLPYLLPPKSGEQQGGGGTSGPISVSYHATLQSGIDLPAVLDHYARQLEEHGSLCAGWRARLAYRNPRLRRPALGDAALRHPQTRSTRHLHAPAGGRRPIVQGAISIPEHPVGQPGPTPHRC